MCFLEGREVHGRHPPIRLGVSGRRNQLPAGGSRATRERDTGTGRTVARAATTRERGKTCITSSTVSPPAVSFRFGRRLGVGDARPLQRDGHLGTLGSLEDLYSYRSFSFLPTRGRWYERRTDRTSVSEACHLLHSWGTGKGLDMQPRHLD